MIRHITHKELIRTTTKVLPKCLVWVNEHLQEVLTPQHQTSPSEQEGEPKCEPPMSPTTHSPTSSPTTKIRILLIGFILCGILFCECVFDDDLCENDILKNGL